MFRGCVLCVPGPLGLFRRTAMEEVCYRFSRNTDVSEPGRYLGPFESDTFSEDFDLSAGILSLSYKVVYEPHAIAYTNVPSTLFTLINQRYRWYRGNLQVIRKLFKRATGDPVTAPPRMWLWACVNLLHRYLAGPNLYGHGTGLLYPHADSADKPSRPQVTKHSLSVGSWLCWQWVSLSRPSFLRCIEKRFASAI